MKESKALDQGYADTGIYVGWNEKYKIDAARAKFSARGYKSVVVTVPRDPRSVSSYGGGYSLFAEQKYFDDKETVELRIQLQRIPKEMARLARVYRGENIHREMKALEKDMERITARLKQLGGL